MDSARTTCSWPESSANDFGRHADAVNLLVLPCVSPWGYETVNRWNPDALDPTMEDVDATVAEGRVAQLLNLRPGAPLLRIRQVIYSTKTKPVIYVIGFYRSERHSLFIRRMR